MMPVPTAAVAVMLGSVLSLLGALTYVDVGKGNGRLNKTTATTAFVLTIM